MDLFRLKAILDKKLNVDTFMGFSLKMVGSVEKQENAEFQHCLTFYHNVFKSSSTGLLKARMVRYRVRERGKQMNLNPNPHLPSKICICYLLPSGK